MLRVDRKSKSLSSLAQRSLPDAGWREREDLQQMIKNSPEAFFAEMGEPLMLIGEEIRPTDFVDDRIDLLAIDPEGNSVILELKRGAHKLQLLQALTYAAMVAKWDGQRILDERRRLTGQSPDDVESDVESFLNEPLDALNTGQRIVLMAEGFDYEVMVTAEWLTEQYQMDIRCYRLKLSAEGESEYLSCTCIYPPPEITDHSVRRARRTTDSNTVKWANWEEALSTVENTAVLNFFRQELADGRDDYLRHKKLWWKVNDRRILFTNARKDRAYVWQIGRFQDDLEFWREKLGDSIEAKTVKRERCVRFYLRSVDEFDKFRDAVANDLPSMEFTNSPDELDIESEQDES